MRLYELIGKRVQAVKAFPSNANLVPVFILFDDGCTYIQLEEQDYYSFHDCSPSAGLIEVYSEERSWKHIMESYPDANGYL